MPKYQITAPDGSKYEVNAPEGATEQDALAYVQSQWQATPVPKQSPSVLSQLTRQAGLTGRYALEGIAGGLDSLAAPIRATQDAIRGQQSVPAEGWASLLADKLSLPRPETSTEKIVGAGAKGMAGTLLPMSAAGKLAPGASGTTKEVLNLMASRPGMQAISGTAAGMGGEAAKQEGYGPLGQGVVAFGSALAAPMAADKTLSTFGALKNMLNARLNPQQFDAALKVELGKAGVDWETLSAQARESLRNDVRAALNTSQELDPAALRRLAEFRRIGATPLLGDVTQNPVDITTGRNLAKQMANQRNTFGAPNLAEIQNENAKKVAATIAGTKTSADDAYSAGEQLIRKVQSTDSAMSSQVNDAYKGARDAAGREIPLDGQKFVNDAYESLIKINKGAFLPPEIQQTLETIRSGVARMGGKEYPVNFDVNAIDQLKTTLSAASRSNDGNVRAAVRAVREALDNVVPSPVKTRFGNEQVVTSAMGQQMRAADALPAVALSKFDEARKAAAAQFKWRESASFIEDALGGATPDTFVKKHVIGAPAEELAKLNKFLGKDEQLRQSVKSQLTDYILTRGNVDEAGGFTQKGINDALKQIGDRKLYMFFDKKEIADLKAAAGVAKSMQFQPIGSAVNNSNTGALLLGRLADMMGKATPIPFAGPMVAEPLQGGLLSLQARAVANASRGLLAPQQPQSSAYPIPLGLLFGGLTVPPPSKDDPSAYPGKP